MDEAETLPEDDFEETVEVPDELWDHEVNDKVLQALWGPTDEIIRLSELAQAHLVRSKISKYDLCWACGWWPEVMTARSQSEQRYNKFKRKEHNDLGGKDEDRADKEVDQQEFQCKLDK